MAAWHLTILLFSTSLFWCGESLLLAQVVDFTAIRTEVDFAKKLLDWDGFGVNYVEVAQTVDYNADPEDYGCFSLLEESERQKILDLVFGDDGWRPGTLKIFLDPFHQPEPGGPFDHEKTTRWTRYVAREGLKWTQARGEELSIITTLYGPPAWASQQKFLRGRDLDPERKRDLANYLIDWVRYLRDKEELPVDFVSLHNEGEDWTRWPRDGKSGNIGTGHDYNMYWPPEQVVDFLEFMRPMLDEAGLEEVGLAPGETSSWDRFCTWGYSDAIANAPLALKQLGLITSHGFDNGTYGNRGTDAVRALRPELKAWVTSTSWSDTDATFAWQLYCNIYYNRVNSIIPWAFIKGPREWVGGDVNPGCAFHIYADGTWESLPGYYYFKQLARAGQRGTAVVHTVSMHSKVSLIGFASNGSHHPDAVVVINSGDYPQLISVRIHHSTCDKFAAYRTTDEGEQYRSLGQFELNDGVIMYSAPKRSATTFLGLK